MQGTLFDITGRVALVTGGSKGLGLAMAGWNSAMSLAVDEDEQGRAAGLVQGVTSLAYMVSPILVGAAYGVSSSLPFLLLVPILLVASGLGGLSRGVRRAHARGSRTPDAIPVEPSP